MKRNAMTWLQTLVLLAFLGIAAAVLFPVFARRSGPEGHRPICQSNLR